jgi:hypothetical protein
MKVGLVAPHFPHPEHFDEMISRVHRAAEERPAHRRIKTARPAYFAEITSLRFFLMTR